MAFSPATGGSMLCIRWLFFPHTWLYSSAIFIDDTAWMRAMIPHHSTAIMTSENANLTDSRAQQLSEEIIQAQEEEIAEMEQLIEDIEENGEE